MAKGQYHINNDNRRLPCSAEFKCEFASNAPHFNTPREADDWLEMEALSRSVYDTMVQEFGKENLDPKMMASMGVTEWTLHARDPENYPYPGDPAELLPAALGETDAVVEESPKVESTATLVESIDNVSIIDIDLNVPPPPSVKEEVAEASQPIPMETLEAAIDNFHIVDIDIAPPPQAVEPEKPAQEEPSEYGRDSAGWLDPETGQFALDFDVSSMRIARPIYDIDDDRYWEPETDDEMVEEALRYAGWDDDDLAEALARRMELRDEEESGYTRGWEASDVRRAVPSWIARNFDKPIDEEEAAAALEAWSETAQGRGRVSVYDSIDALDGEREESETNCIIEFDIVDEFSEPDTLLAGTPSQGDANEGWVFMRSLAEDDYNFDGGDYSLYAERNDDGSITRYVDKDALVAVNIDPMHQYVSQQVAKRKYGSKEDEVAYRAYRWDAKEREQLKTYYDFLTSDSAFADLEMTPQQKDALNSLRKLQYQSAVIDNLMEDYVSDSTYDMDKDDALIDLKMRLKYDGYHDSDDFISHVQEGLRSGNYKIDSDSDSPTLSDIKKGNRSRDGWNNRLKSLRGRAARGGSYTDMSNAVAKRSYVPNISTVKKPEEVTQAETVMAAFAGRTIARQEALTYKRGNLARVTLDNASRGWAQAWDRGIDKSRNNDFMVTYKDEEGRTRFGYAPQTKKDGTLDIVHLPAEATLVDADGLEYPDPYFIKAARGEYFFGGTAFKPGDVENIEVNSDDTTTSKYDLKLW